MNERAEAVLTPEHPFVEAVHRELRHVYGSRLRSVAIFGSVARRTARRDSDLDLQDARFAASLIDSFPEDRE